MRDVAPSNPSDRSSSRYVLLVLGDAQGQYASFPLPDGGSVTIGRSHKCDIRIDDPSISRRHAILHIGPTISIEDLESANGTRVRDARLVYASTLDSAETVEFHDRGVKSDRVVEVSPGDVIELGSAVVVVQHAVSQGRPRRLWAHGYFEGRLEEECARADRNRSTFAVFRVHVGASAEAGPVEQGPILLEHLPVEKMGNTLPAGSPAFRPSEPPPPALPRPHPPGPAVSHAPTLPPRPPPPPADVGSTPDELRRQLEVAERNRILQALDACAGNQTRAAKVLGISRRTLVSRLDAYGIPRPRKNPSRGG